MVGRAGKENQGTTWPTPSTRQELILLPCPRFHTLFPGLQLAALTASPFSPLSSPCSSAAGRVPFCPAEPAAAGPAGAEASPRRSAAVSWAPGTAAPPRAFSESSCGAGSLPLHPAAFLSEPLLRRT